MELIAILIALTLFNVYGTETAVEEGPKVKAAIEEHAAKVNEQIKDKLPPMPEMDPAIKHSGSLKEAAEHVLEKKDAK